MSQKLLNFTTYAPHIVAAKAIIQKTPQILSNSITYTPHILAAFVTFGQDDFTIANGFHAADFLRDAFKTKLKL